MLRSKPNFCAPQAGECLRQQNVTERSRRSISSDFSPYASVRARALSFDLITGSHPDPVGEHEMTGYQFGYRSLDAPGALVRIVVAA
jgi:hypothetical protein